MAIGIMELIVQGLYLIRAQVIMLEMDYLIMA